MDGHDRVTPARDIHDLFLLVSLRACDEMLAERKGPLQVRIQRQGVVLEVDG